MDIQEATSKRNNMLIWVYENSSADTLHSFTFEEIKNALGLDEGNFDRIVNYLEEERLIYFTAFGKLAITIQGIKQAERIYTQWKNSQN